MAQKNSKEKILHAALSEFEYCGYSGTSCDAIASRAGVSKTLLFKYYGTKENILKEALSYIFDEIFGEFNAIAKRSGHTVAALVEDCFQQTKRIRPRFQFIVSILTTPALASYCSEICLSLLRRIEDLLEGYRGEIAENQFKAFAYLCLALFASYVIAGDEDNFQRVKRSLLQQYLIPVEPE